MNVTIFHLQISSLTLVFDAWISGVVLDVRSVAGVDLLSLDGRLAVRCSNTTLPYQEVKRFIRVARWIYKADPSNDTAIVQWHVRSLFAHYIFTILGPSVLCVEAVCLRNS